MRRIYCDVDGTLLHGWLDEMYRLSGCDVAWYNQQYVDNLAVNCEVVNVLREYKARGYELILWTNRGHAQRAMTQANLGELWYMFDDHRFYDGKKYGTNKDGHTLDNEGKYLEHTEGTLVCW
jgi:FMN phosphatase YigB (HAD superfamily)